ncbi:MAG: hypothetical protein WDN48_04865 [Pseudolabrys sp.]
MSVLLLGIGALAAAVGAILIGFGIPINEFSFGNTLIVAGTTAFIGGLIVTGLGVVVMQLQRLTEALASRPPIRANRPLDVFDSSGGSRPGTGRVPFPPKPKLEKSEAAEAHEPAPLPVEEHSFAPTLRNPDDQPPTVEDDISLSPQQPTPQPAADEVSPSFEFNDVETPDSRHEPSMDAGWRSPPPMAPARPHTAYFDAMWPAEAKPAKVPAEAKPEPKFEPAQRDEPEAPMSRPSEPRTVAILKSGVVDGMGYTLYVDGSIEAELPQGTLRFASINELRSHLEKNA